VRKAMPNYWYMETALLLLPATVSITPCAQPPAKALETWLPAAYAVFSYRLIHPQKAAMLAADGGKG